MALHTHGKRVSGTARSFSGSRKGGGLGRTVSSVARGKTRVTATTTGGGTLFSGRVKQRGRGRA